MDTIIDILTVIILILGISILAILLILYNRGIALYGKTKKMLKGIMTNKRRNILEHKITIIKKK